MPPTDDTSLMQFAQDPRPKLHHYFSHLPNGQFPSGLHLLVWTRELLEFVKSQERYAIANLYGNWSVHTRLTGSSAGYELLVRLNHHFVTLNRRSQLPQSEDGLAEFARDVANELSPTQLRAELRTLYAEHGIPAHFLESHSAWYSTLADIFSCVQGKPIGFPSDDVEEWRPKVRAMFEKARSGSIAEFGHHRVFIKWFLVELVHVPGINERPDTGTMHWSCITEANIKFQGAVNSSMFEPRSAFATD